MSEQTGSSAPLGAAGDDLESPDAAPLDAGFDLTPRTSPQAARGGGRDAGRRRLAIGALVVLFAALGFVLVRGLGDAATFFLNVDEALERRDELEGERFRMQGNVVPGSLEERADGVDFVLRFNGEEVAVRHTGTPPELFDAGIPVVLEGSFAGEGFESDEILIRHDASYDEEHEDRIREAEADVGSPATGDSGAESGSDDSSESG